ncbi:hypothetical protein EDD11_001603 [Mortierella claussenii]|nr:hypothetical protein EDD11_001603 [Mortierella claussenii]
MRFAAATSKLKCAFASEAKGQGAAASRTNIGLYDDISATENVASLNRIYNGHRYLSSLTPFCSRSSISEKDMVTTFWKSESFKIQDILRSTNFTPAQDVMMWLGTKDPGRSLQHQLHVSDDK